MTQATTLRNYAELINEGFTDHELNSLISVCHHDMIEAMQVIQEIRCGVEY